MNGVEIKLSSGEVALLFTCPVCGAAVVGAALKLHLDWHDAGA